MPKRSKSKALAKPATLSAAAARADAEIERSDLWTFLGDVVQGTKQTYVLSTSNAKGKAIRGQPRLQDRIKCAELLLQYRYGRPSQADPTQASKPEERKDRPVKPGEIVDEVIAMMERAARLAKLREEARQLPEGHAEPVQDLSNTG